MAAAAATSPIRSESPFYDADPASQVPSSFSPIDFDIAVTIPIPTPVLPPPRSHRASPREPRERQQQQTEVLQLRERRHVRPLLAALARVYAVTGYPVEGVPEAASTTGDQLLALLSGASVGTVGTGPGGRPKGEVAGLVVMMATGDVASGREQDVGEYQAAAAATTTTTMAMMTPVGHVSMQAMAEHGDRTPTRLWMEWNWKERGWSVDAGVGGGHRRDGGGEEQDGVFAEAAELLANTWMLAKLFVDPRAWGRRYGELLVAAAEEMATAAGKWLVLIVIEKDKAAIRLYEKRGWVRFAVADHRDPSGKVWHQYCYVAPRSADASNNGGNLSPTSCHEILRQHGRWYTSAKE